MKKILITGASGFIGTNLSRFFLTKGFSVVGIGTSDRHPFAEQFQAFEWISADTTKEGNWQKKIPQADVIINVTGKSIFHYWTKKYKQAIYDSRILTTRNLVTAMESTTAQILLNTSAVGIYGDGKETNLTETSPSGTGFLSQVCVDWEAEALKAMEKGARVNIMRLGVVLGSGGALQQMLPAFKWGVGGPLGSGRQWFPWVHIKEIENACMFLIQNVETSGVFNFVGLEQVRQKQFAGKLGKALSRPAVIPAPAIVIKTVMGEMGRSLLQSQKAEPSALVEADYSFLFPDVTGALQDILGK